MNKYIFHFFKYKLSLKIFISFLLIIIIPAITSFVISYYLIKSTILYEIKLRLKDSITGYYQQLKFMENNCVKISSELSSDAEIRLLLAEKRFIKLKRRLMQIYKIGNIDVIEIEDNRGKVIIRGHNPKLSGDVKINQYIIKQGLKGITTVGYEKGKSGFAIRAVSPIFYKKKLNGLLMIGASFSSKLVNHIKLLTELENGIYKDNTKIISTYIGYDNLENSIIKRLKQNKTIFLKNVSLNNKQGYFILKPLFLKNKIFWGCISMGLSRDDAKRYLHYSNNMLILIIGIGIFMAFFIYFFLAKNINNSLKIIISGINNIKVGKFSTRIKLNSEDEFKQIAVNINNMLDKIYLYNKRIKELQDGMIKSAKLNTAGQIAAGIAHEIRNPLSSIKMMIQIIKKRYIKKNAVKEIDFVLNEIDRISSLVKDLLEFAKPSRMNFSKQNINDIIFEVIKLFSYKIKHQHIKVVISLNKQIPNFYFDSEKMKLVFINIIINAIQSMPESGVLNIETSLQKKEKILIKVCDTGQGIKKMDLKYIFEPFFTTKKDGTGLGLALCKTIINRHKGTIKIKSNKNGTCIFIYLNIYTSINKFKE